MDDRLRNWHPTQAEVRQIVDELRPLIQEMARRQQAAVSPGTAATFATVPTARRRTVAVAAVA